MGELILNNELSAMADKSRISDNDVLVLRRTVFKDGVVTRSEAESLFALDRVVADKSEAWVVFFVEAVTDFLVMVEAPKGYISEENANWLMRAISSDGVVDTRTELEILLRSMEKATSMPASLSAFALAQVKSAVVDGDGPLAAGRLCAKGIVTADDVHMLRRVLYSNSGDTGLGISRAEAEVLFDINDLTIEAANDASWSDLFSKAIAFSLMAATGHLPQSSEKALAREAWLEDTSVDVGGFFGSIFSGGLRAYGEKMMSDNSVEAAYREQNAASEAANAKTEAIDAEETAWLIERVGRDGVLHENERILIEFLKNESPRLHPSLKPLLDKVA